MILTATSRILDVFYCRRVKWTDATDAGRRGGDARRRARRGASARYGAYCGAPVGGGDSGCHGARDGAKKFLVIENGAPTPLLSSPSTPFSRSPLTMLSIVYTVLSQLILDGDTTKPMPLLGYGTCCRPTAKGPPLIKSTKEYFDRMAKSSDS